MTIVESPSPHEIKTADDLVAVLGEAHDFVRDKVLSRLSEPAQGFISHSPLIFVATADEHGGLDVSPKGDPAGFVAIESPTTLLIPERRGNNLAFGPRNILSTGRIGLIFAIPGQRETLRVNGSATLSTDPALLDQLHVHGKPALLCTRVTVEECFFHCGKALVRSQAWQSDSWDRAIGSFMIKEAATAMGDDPSVEAAIAAAVEKDYAERLY